MADAYAYEQQDSQDMEDQAKHIARCVAKLKGSSRNSQLKVLAGLLEQLPQDVKALGPHPAREALLKALHNTSILHSKQKDVRMYAAACFAQLLRIYAPETPYEEQKQLEVRRTAKPRPHSTTAVTAASGRTRTVAAPLTQPVLFLPCSPCLTCCCGA
jgi:hypothetical protein